MKRLLKIFFIILPLISFTPDELLSASSVTEVSVGLQPYSVAIDTTLNKAVVTNYNDDSISIIDLGSKQVTRTITVSDTRPRGAAINPNTNKAVIANEKSNTLSVLDLNTEAIIATIPVGRSPEGVAINPNTNVAVVTNRKDDTITIIDLSLNTALTLLKVGKDPSGVAINSATNQAVIANNKDDTITIVDLNNNTVIATINVGGGPQAVAIDEDKNIGIITNEKSDAVSILDLSAKTIIKIIPSGKKPRDIAINKNTQMAYITNKLGDAIAAIDLITYTQKGYIQAGKDPQGIAIDDSTNTAVVANTKANTVSVIDISSVPFVIPTPQGRNPEAVAINKASNTAIIANKKSDNISVLDLSQLIIKTLINVGKEPQDVAINPETNQAVVINEKDDTASIIDLSTNNVISAINVGKGPSGVAVNTISNTAAVTNKKDDTITIIDLNSKAVIAVINTVKSPKAIAVNPDTNQAVVISEKGDSVAIIDLTNRQTLTTLNINKEPKDAAINPEANIALIIAEEDVNNQKRGSLLIIDLNTSTVKETITIGEEPVSIAINPSTNIAVIADKKANALYIFDLTAKQVIDTYTTERPKDIAVNPYTNQAVVINDKDDAINLFQLTNPAPVITRIMPELLYSGDPDTTITIQGERFITKSVAYFNTTALNTTFINNKELQAVIPSSLLAQSGTAAIKVVNPPPGGGASNTLNIQITGLAISGFAPLSGPAGTAVTIIGTGFDPEPAKNTVQFFNGKKAVITSSSATTITAIAPQGAETGPITVTTPYGAATSSNSFEITLSENFNITASPVQTTVVQGDTINYQITITSSGLNPFTSLTEVTVTGLPQGATTTFTPSKYINTAKGVTLTIDTKGVSTIGVYDITINAKATIDGKVITRTAPVKLDIASAGGTVLTGSIFASKDKKPLKNVKLTIGSIITYTDDAGNFIVSNPPLGDQVVLIDADTANTQNAAYPSRLPVPVTILSGKINKLPYQVHIHEVNTKYFTQINPSTDTIAKDPNIPDFEIKVPAGVNIIGWDNQPNTKVSMTKVALDRLPTAPLPVNVNTRSVYMFYFGKPGGGKPSQPIPVTFPNDIGAEPGEVVDLYYYDEEPMPDPNSNQWKKLGTGRVTSDGKRIVSDPGVGIPKFCCGAAFASRQTSGSPQPAPPDGTCPVADPVDPSTGLFFFKETDLTLTGIMPVSITRTYRTLEQGVGPFGIGVSFNYDLMLLSAGSQALWYILPDGGRYLFSLQPDNTYTNSSYPFLRGVIVTVNPDGTYQMRFKDGMLYTFDSNGRLIEQRNRNNDSINITRDSNGSIIAITEPKGRSLQFTNGPGFFTDRGWVYLITSITDPIGRRVEYNYDSEGRLIEVKNSEGGITRYTYDSGMRITSIINPKGITVVTNQYDGAGRVSQQTHADGGIFNIKYTTAGSATTQTEVTDPLGNTTIYRFNSSRYCTEIINPVGGQTIRDYAIGTNLLNSVTDELGRTTTYNYDSNGNITSMTDPAGNITSYQYEPTFNKLTQIQDALGNITRLGYDGNGNLTTITDPLNNTTTITYNQYGQPLTVTDALSNTTTYEYDGYGNLIKTTDPLGNSSAMQYDLIGRLIAATDPKGDTTLYNYDQRSRIKEITDAIKGKTRFAYDQNGNLLSVTDAKNQTITYTYNVRDKAASMTDQLNRVEAYQYDTNDNLVSFTDRKGQATTYTYDQMNRITRADYADGSNATYTYNAVGRLTTVTDSVTGTISYTYSDTGCPSCGGVDKLMQEVTLLGSISYAYDAIGRRTSMTVSGQPAVNYNYDGNSRLAGINTIINGVGQGFSLAYDALGRRISLTLPNSVTTNYSYDNASRLLDITHQNLTQVIERLVYGYDAKGNRTSMERVGVPVKLPNPASNINYNQANQMLTFQPETQSAKNMVYDENGNMTSVTNGCGTTNYIWNARNQLIGINGFDSACASLTASFKYDALGRRTEKTVNAKTTQYLYDGLDIVQEIENSVVTANYVRTMNIDEPLARIKADVSVRYYQQDALGSVIALTDDTGAVKTQYSYDPYGGVAVVGEVSDNPFQYTGRENDGTGLYYYRARYYSPELQRFIREDPIKFRGGINFYRYTFNNPLVFIDPLGLKVACVYSQSTGEMVCTDDTGQRVVDAQCYAGRGIGKNDPDWQDVTNVGPITRGDWDIGTSEDRGTGPVTLPLTPQWGNDIFDTSRDPDTFLIHGDNINNPGNASKGCIVCPPSARQTINNQGGGTVHVTW